MRLKSDDVRPTFPEGEEWREGWLDELETWFPHINPMAFNALRRQVAGRPYVAQYYGEIPQRYLPDAFRQYSSLQEAASAIVTGNLKISNIGPKGKAEIGKVLGMDSLPSLGDRIQERNSRLKVSVLMLVEEYIKDIEALR